MTTDARQLAERIVREYERCQIEGCDLTCLQTRLYKAYQAGRLSGLQQAAEIADACRDVTAAHIAACIRVKIAEHGGEAEQ